MKIHLFPQFGPEVIAEIEDEQAPPCFVTTVHGHEEEFVLDGADLNGLPVYEGYTPDGR